MRPQVRRERFSRCSTRRLRKAKIPPIRGNDGSGLSWLFPLENCAPPIGWHDAGAYLVLPVLLTGTQFLTQRLMSPTTNSDDPSQQSTQAILKFLPLMIGYFSLNVPSGLTLYWFVNNLLSTAQQIYLKSAAGSSESVKAVENSLASFDMNAGPSSLGENGPQVVVEPTMRADSASAPRRTGGPPKPSRGAKFRARKEAEAAAKAGDADGEGDDGPVAAEFMEAAEAGEVAAVGAASAASSGEDDDDTSSGGSGRAKAKKGKGRRRR